jgi:predicted hotdog family 3-hydroxylacyl-ACP dehydratase
VKPLPSPAELLPHSGRAVLLDEVVEGDAERVLCRVTIREGSPFLEGGTVPGVVVLEYMAQAIGTLAGLRARASGEPPRVGFLLGTRDLSVPPGGFAPGDEILVEAVRVFGDESIGSFACVARRGGEVVAEGTLNVYLPPTGEFPA